MQPFFIMNVGQKVQCVEQPNDILILIFSMEHIIFILRT